ncbi:CCCH-type Zn finger-containing protein [Perkinsela sp. CCAP 1560/4]|nr:CCCH-type Zn finger-containing protein [Perkinsela sp. CCAP 1560/4]|eukprot:KNH06673.1 CCCH-type Zn finger-containing protein [Perkinsela sp. CCAP 1560/4]
MLHLFGFFDSAFKTIKMNPFAENGLNVNASPWSGPASMNIAAGVENEISTLKSLTQQAAHVSLYPPSMETASGRAKQICKFFLAGGCSRGDACPFLHELPKDSTLLECTNSTTSVTGIVFNLNAKNTFSALHKQSMTEGSGLGQEVASSDREAYGEYSPLMSDLQQGSSDYYTSYLRNNLYTSQYGSLGSWSNQLTSEFAQKPQYDQLRSNDSHSYNRQYEFAGSATQVSPSPKTNYGTYYNGDHYSTMGHSAHDNSVAETKESVSNDIYWPSGELEKNFIVSGTPSYLLSQEDEARAEAMKSVGPLSYAAVAQKRSPSGSSGILHEDEEKEMGNTAYGMESPAFGNIPSVSGYTHDVFPDREYPYLDASYIDKNSPGANPGIIKDTHEKAPSPARPEEASQEDEIEPHWRPISKSGSKLKHAENKPLKHIVRTKKGNESESESFGKTPENPRVYTQIAPRKSLSSHKIQLPNPLLWTKRTISDNLRRPMRTLLQIITGTPSPKDVTPGESQESECLRPLVELNLDGMNVKCHKSYAKTKTSPMPGANELRFGATTKNSKGLQKSVSVEVPKDRKDRTLRTHNASFDHTHQRGGRSALRGRGGYGGQAYHETRMPTGLKSDVLSQ